MPELTTARRIHAENATRYADPADTYRPPPSSIPAVRASRPPGRCSYCRQHRPDDPPLACASRRLDGIACGPADGSVRKIRSAPGASPDHSRVRRAADASRRRQYGILWLEYDQLVLDSCGVCPLCVRQADLYIDHNHKTNKVRGLLCNRCNQHLGYVEVYGHDDSWMARAIGYLQERGRQRKREFDPVHSESRWSRR